jgi:hypothetical protein
MTVLDRIVEDEAAEVEGLRPGRRSCGNWRRVERGAGLRGGAAPGPDGRDRGGEAALAVGGFDPGGRDGEAAAEVARAYDGRRRGRSAC